MRERQKGLTLVELLIALLIFALIASAAVYALRLSANARDQLEEANSEIGEIEIARMVMKEDFALSLARPVRDAYGAPAGPAFLGGMETLRRPSVVGERLLVAFVRSGWLNPEGAAPRSSLQYVEYVEKDGALIRRSRAYLDDARGQAPVERALISDAGEISVSFLAGQTPSDLLWVEGWPAPATAGASGGPPKAVAITATLPRIGEIRQLFWIGEIAAPARAGA